MHVTLSLCETCRTFQIWSSLRSVTVWRSNTQTYHKWKKKIKKKNRNNLRIMMHSGWNPPYKVCMSIFSSAYTGSTPQQAMLGSMLWLWCSTSVHYDHILSKKKKSTREEEYAVGREITTTKMVSSRHVCILDCHEFTSTRLEKKKRLVLPWGILTHEATSVGGAGLCCQGPIRWGTFPRVTDKLRALCCIQSSLHIRKNSGGKKKRLDCRGQEYHSNINVKFVANEAKIPVW